MLSTDSSSSPGAIVGATTCGWLEDMAGLFSTGLSVTVVVVERGKVKGVSLCRPLVMGFSSGFYSTSDYRDTLFYLSVLRLHVRPSMPLDRRSFKSPPVSLTSTRASQAVRRAQVRSRNPSDTYRREND